MVVLKWPTPAIISAVIGAISQSHYHCGKSKTAGAAGEPGEIAEAAAAAVAAGQTRNFRIRDGSHSWGAGSDCTCSGSRGRRQGAGRGGKISGSGRRRGDGRDGRFTGSGGRRLGSRELAAAASS